MKAKVLLIEDEEDIIDFVRWELENEGYEVAVAYSGDHGYNMAISHVWDLILLDLMLPEMDGMEVCKRLRTTSTTPIIMLTALSDVQDRIAGLDAGADDYLPKPFSIDELFARIRVILRRSPIDFRDVIEIDDLIMDTNSFDVIRGGQSISLSPKEFKLLEFLVRNATLVLTREKILDNVWGNDYFTGHNVVDVYIRYLRQKIDEPFPNKLIHTVRGVGYTLRRGSQA